MTLFPSQKRKYLTGYIHSLLKVAMPEKKKTEKLPSLRISVIAENIQ
jgi:hypothetical protein